MLRINLLDVSHDVIPEQPSRLIWLVALLVVLLCASIAAAGYVGLVQQRDTLAETFTISEERREAVRAELAAAREQAGAIEQLQATLDESLELTEAPNTNYAALASVLANLDANDDDMPLIEQAMVASNELQLSAVAEDARQLRRWYEEVSSRDGLQNLIITAMRAETITDRRDGESTIRFSAWAKLDQPASGGQP